MFWNYYSFLMETMDEKCSAAPAATTQNTHASKTAQDEDEEETPLLFMDELPSNFQQSAQLAAIATFVADSDDDAAVDGREDVTEDGYGIKQRRQLRHKPMRTRRRQQPYMKPIQKDKESRNQKNTDETKSTDTKELQLFLSMFHVS
ncbi:hypothetical protein PI125_g3538 [Phytophthora idaei]|nr:hypothetical protein PI125_g3538 [Phytophthora idaei]